jgi:hypothetical protein
MNEKVSTKNVTGIELSIRTVKPRTVATGANGVRTEQPEGARVVVVTSW